MIKLFSIVTLFLLLVSCSSFYRKPSSAQNGDGSISSLITELSSLVGEEHFVDQDCKSELPELSLKVKNYDWSLLSNDELKAHAKKSCGDPALLKDR